MPPCRAGLPDAAIQSLRQDEIRTRNERRLTHDRYRAAKKSKDEVPIDVFRKECRDFAEHWIGVQRAEFKRLGVLGDWEHPYTTMELDAEAENVREIGKLLM